TTLDRSSPASRSCERCGATSTIRRRTSSTSTLAICDASSATRAMPSPSPPCAHAVTGSRTRLDPPIEPGLEAGCLGDRSSGCGLRGDLRGRLRADREPAALTDRRRCHRRRQPTFGNRPLAPGRFSGAADRGAAALRTRSALYRHLLAAVRAGAWLHPRQQPPRVVRRAPT